MADAAQPIGAERHYIDPNSPEARSAAAGSPVDPAPSYPSDPVDPAPAPAPTPPTQESAPPAPSPDEPPLFDDPRNAIARRAKERGGRAVNLPPNIDFDSIPEGVPLEGQAPIEPAPQEPAPAPAPSGQGNEPQRLAPAGEYTLTVNGNSIRVSREDALRYAGFEDEAHASGVPDASLVKWAQMNLAAEMNLEAARQAKRMARQGDPSGEHHATEPPSPTPAPQDDVRQRRLELMETIQIGEPEAALRAKEELDRMDFEALSTQTRVRERFNSAVEQVNQAVAEAASQNRDILADPMLTDVYKSAIARSVVDELQRVRPDLVTDVKRLELLNNPTEAITAYHGAIAGGHNVRKPADLLNDAARSVRERFVQGQSAAPRHQAPASRQEQKQRLMQQPTRTDYAPQAPASAPPPGHRNLSAVISRMRAARHQGDAY